MVRALALMVLAGCGDPLRADIACEPGPFASVMAEAPDGCASLALAAPLAMGLLLDSGAIERAELTAVMGHTAVAVRAGDAWQGATKEIGGFTFGASAQVDRLGSSLVHELLHRVEVDRFALGSTWHEGWTKRGWDGLDAVYRAAIHGNGRCWPAEPTEAQRAALEAASWPVGELLFGPCAERLDR